MTYCNITALNPKGGEVMGHNQKFPRDLKTQVRRKNSPILFSFQISSSEGSPKTETSSAYLASMPCTLYWPLNEQTCLRVLKPRNTDGPWTTLILHCRKWVQQLHHVLEHTLSVDSIKSVSSFITNYYYSVPHYPHGIFHFLIPDGVNQRIE